MSIIKANKIQSGLSTTPANNFIFDSGSNDGSMILKRESGETILNIDGSGVVNVNNIGDIFGKENILGTVSQIGGIPTGGIIESGVNANGEYAMFANGTAIALCTDKTGVTTNTAYSTGLYWNNAAHGVTYPITIIGSIRVFGQSVGPTASYGWVNIWHSTSTAGTIGAWSSNAANTCTVKIGVIGRWF